MYKLFFSLILGSLVLIPCKIEAQGKVKSMRKNQYKIYERIERLEKMAYCERDGDLNRDGVVDDADLLIVLFNFDKEGSYEHGDANCDGKVDELDLRIVLQNFGNNYRR